MPSEDSYTVGGHTSCTGEMAPSFTDQEKQFSRHRRRQAIYGQRRYASRPQNERGSLKIPTTDDDFVLSQRVDTFVILF